MTFDLSAAGGPANITLEELTEHVRAAKTKVKRSARGWSMLSHVEVLALCWFVDLFFDDAPEPGAIIGTYVPPTISDL